MISNTLDVDQLWRNGSRNAELSTLPKGEELTGLIKQSPDRRRRAKTNSSRTCFQNAVKIKPEELKGN